MNRYALALGKEPTKKINVRLIQFPGRVVLKSPLIKKEDINGDKTDYRQGLQKLRTCSE